MPAFTCIRCGNEWTKEGPEPVRCPRCRTFYWRSPYPVVPCLSCGFSWTPRGAPKRCPRCGSHDMGEVRIRARCRHCLSLATFPMGSTPEICPSCLRDDWIDGEGSRSGAAPKGTKAERIRELSASGMSSVDIARELDIPFATVMSAMGKGHRRW